MSCHGIVSSYILYVPTVRIALLPYMDYVFIRLRIQLMAGFFTEKIHNINNVRLDSYTKIFKDNSVLECTYSILFSFTSTFLSND